MAPEKIDVSDIAYSFIPVNKDEPVDKDFESSETEFTEYYFEQSRYDVQENLVKMYVLKVNDKVWGYITIAMAHLKCRCNKRDKKYGS